ncbi:protein Hook homolog 3-like [Tigriopus californicus]|uniref:protein Hook homolog 3-like n=1 Tax=Tigriopus californicus TaxID=6832 RepID=UPI0027DA74D6|nr:protein Hook homolog 3-like [Tigriopus californicus]
MSDLKRQLKILEEKNTEFMQRNMDLEEDVKKTGNWRPQVDAYKKQIAELHAKLDSESKKSDRLEFETKRLLEKVESLTVEKDRLHHEREQLRMKHDELQDEIKFGQATAAETQSGLLDDGEPDSGTLEMIPPSIKERLLRLQRENKRLNVALSGGGSSALLGRDSGNIQVLQSMIDTMKERSNELEDANRKANQKILELESKLEDHLASTNVAVPRIPGSKEELELKLSESKKKVASLQETMQKKDMEIQGMEERYKRYIEKAKSVIKTFEPKQGGVAGGSGGSVGGPELVMLRSQINDKDRIIENIEQENEKARAVREMEDRLITSAFYNLSMQMHRNAVESRLGTSAIMIL